MKLTTYIISTAYILLFIGCKGKHTYTIDKLEVKPDSLYNEEATLFLDKSISVEQFDKAIKVQIGNDSPLFLQFSGQNENYERTNNPLDYNMNYNTKTNGVYYEVSLMKTKEGNPYLTLGLQEMNKHPTDTKHYNTTGSGIGGALMEFERNKVHINITANSR